MLSGVCLQQRAAAGDPDARTALALPRGFGGKSPQWRFADTLPDVDSLDITQTLSGTLDLVIRPFLPTPDTRRPAIYAFASAARDEQQAALTWSRNRGVPLYLGTCAEADGVARALYGKEVRTVAVSAPPRPLVTAPITGTKVLTESIAQVTPDAIPAALPPSGGTYGLAVVGADNNCPGNYVVGRVLNAAGGPVPGVTVRMVDQWGNQSVAVSKSGASDFGRFDFPLYPSGPRDLYVTVLDERGSPASPTVTLRYPPPEGTPCYYVEWKRTTG
ncbi:MAG: carboxypeptidase regulatory-like domain-containing protein [Caldilineaceae bacterium]|nr:carboxypeptidase regulatory-like domain-containing protein [Caldilineaceae bacterium]